jgi:DNA-binding beta-propeller fold protein YncE
MNRFFAFALLGFLAAAPARANEDSIDPTRAVFVSLVDQPAVELIDPDTDKLAGRLDIGLVPRQIELASSIGKLLAIDGQSPQVNIVDLNAATIRIVALDLVPDRLTVTPDGLTAALANTGSGRVVLLDLLRRRILGSVSDLPALRDMVFSADSAKLYLAGEHQGAIDVISVSTGRLEAAIATAVPHGSLALRRAPNGRRLFLQPDGGGGVAVLDLDRSAALDPIPAGPAPTVAFPSATGAYLLVADNQLGTLTIVHNGDAQNAAVLKASTGVEAIYTAWFDTLALVPSEAARAVLLYDLEAMRPAGSITLAAAAGRGAVTPDGQKLYLPLADAGEVAVIDARQRRLTASIAVPGHPVSAVLAGSYGVCH